MNFKRIISSKNYINIICFSFLFLFKYIFCCTNDCLNEGELCKKDCRNSIYGKTFYCNGLSSSTYPYFYVYRYNEPDNECRLRKSCPNKVIYGSNECVPDCVNYYEIGDFCFEPNYFQSTINADNIYVPELLIGDKKKYKCKKYTYIQLIDEREYHICIDDPQNPALSDGKVKNKCPSLYYDSDEMKCVDSCENKVIINQSGNDLVGSFTYYECKNNCQFKIDGIIVPGYEYNESYDITGSKNIFCYEQKCPDITSFYYEIDRQPRKCRKDCSQNHFYDVHHKCFTQCDSEAKLYLFDDMKNYFYCFANTEYSTSKNCPSSHPYKYQNGCFKSCRDTQLNELIDKKKTYLFNDNGEKMCVENCYNYNNLFFDDDDSLSCVKDCKKTNYKFHYNHKCVYSCPKYYTKKSLESSDGENDLECVDSCPDGYLYNNICLQICPKSSDNPYIDLEKKKCSICKVPQDTSDIKEGEGYIVNSEFIEKNGINVICRSSCPSGTYYKSRDNICYDLITESNDECYFEDGNFNICYPSCQDIPGAKHLNENRMNGRNICYTQLNCGNQYFYIKNNSIKRCIDDDDTFISNRPKYVRECTKQNFNYLRDKQCIADCDSNTEYKIEPTSTIYDGITVLGRCCVSPDCDINYPYYSEEEKILKKNCNLKLIEKEGDNIIKSSKGTCVSECPEDYPYESEDGKLCLLSCPKFYYNIGDKKKCIDNCKSIGKFYFDGEKECKESCTKKISEEITNYYYDDSDNACLYSCKERNMHSLKVIDSPQRCIDSCSGSNKYYFESNYICLPSCDGGFYKSVNENICVNQCEAGQFVINGNTCNDECTDQEPFISTETSSSIVYNKCVYSCFEVENMNYKYYINDTKKCVKECPPNTYAYEK